MKEKIIAFLKALKNALMASDKWLHLAAGFTIVALIAPFSILWAVVAAAVIGVGKELYDQISGKGTPELLDIAAVLVGVILAVIFYYYTRAIILYV